MKRTLLSTAIAMAFALPATASEHPYYTTFGIGYNSTYGLGRTDSDPIDNSVDNDIKNSYTMELSLGYMLRDNVAIEGSFVVPSPTQDDSRSEIEQVRFNGFYFLSDDTIKPYLTAGIGYEDLNNPVGEDAANAIAGLGIGLQYDATERLFGRAEVRYDDMISEYPEHASAILEIGYFFGAKGAAATSAAAVAANNMTDASEAQEEAPLTDTNEITEPAADASAEVILDTDGDGIPDTDDKCQGTVADITVDAMGCGVFEGSFHNVTFPFESAVISSETAKALDFIAAETVKYPNLTLNIAGHADASGEEDFNMSISQRRAISAKDYLVAKGVDPKNITVSYFGESKPIASNETKDGRALNRRVEFTVK